MVRAEVGGQSEEVTELRNSKDKLQVYLAANFKDSVNSQRS